MRQLTTRNAVLWSGPQPNVAHAYTACVPSKCRRIQILEIKMLSSAPCMAPSHLAQSLACSVNVEVVVRNLQPIHPTKPIHPTEFESIALFDLLLIPAHVQL